VHEDSTFTTAFHVLLAFREPAAALALRRRLLRESDSPMQASWADMGEVAEAALRMAPHVLLLEHAEGANRASVERLTHVARASPRTRVLMLWHRYSGADLAAFVRHGARGSLPASSTAAEILNAARGVHAGVPWFSRAELVDALRAAPLHRQPAHPPATLPQIDLLTLREREILSLIGGGLTNKEIARQLAISDQTVKTHLHRVYVKLQSSGRFKAFMAESAVQQGGAG
jgi:DNA-binding NarL/FixJ family response regulator